MKNILNKDLSKKFIYIKAFLFLIIAIVGFVYCLLLNQSFTIQTTFLTKNRGVWFSPFDIGHV